MWVWRGRQQNDSLADGYSCREVAVRLRGWVRGNAGCIYAATARDHPHQRQQLVSVKTVHADPGGLHLQLKRSKPERRSAS